MLYGLVSLESEDFETDPRCIKVVFSVRKYIVAIGEYAHDINAWGAFGETFEQFRQALTSLVGLRIVLDVFVRVDDGDR
jgi:hypothetical protein